MTFEAKLKVEGTLGSPSYSFFKAEETIGSNTLGNLLDGLVELAYEFTSQVAAEFGSFFTNPKDDLNGLADWHIFASYPNLENPWQPLASKGMGSAVKEINGFVDNAIIYRQLIIQDFFDTVKHTGHGYYNQFLPDEPKPLLYTGEILDTVITSMGEEKYKELLRYRHQDNKLFYRRSDLPPLVLPKEDSSSPFKKLFRKP